MNIIFVTNAYYPVTGGVERAAAKIAQHLQEMDCRVEVVTAKIPLSLPSFEKIDGIPVHRLPFYVYRDSLKSAVATLIGMPMACLQLLRIANRLKPCVVHVHFIYHNAVCVELIRQKLQKQGIPILVTFHGGDAPAIPESYKSTHPSESKILNWAAKRLLLCADSFTAVSASLRQKILRSMANGKINIKIIHNGVDEEVFAPSQAQREKKVILAIGRLSYAKGFDILLQAFANLLSDLPDWELRLAGDGELRLALEKLAADLKLENRIHFLGMLPTETLVTELNDSALVAAPSRWEGFSLTALETMSCGKPLIISDLGMARELVTDRVNGIIVPRENPEALAQAMQYLISQPELRREMGRRAREHVMANFTWEQAARKYKQIYSNLLHGAKAGTI